MLKHLHSVGKYLGESGQDGTDLFQEGWSLRSPSWYVTEALVNRPQQWMVIAELLEILCPALNFRDRNDHIRVSWIRTKCIFRKWPPSTECVDDQDSIGVDVDFGGVLWFCHESLWWHVQGVPGAFVCIISVMWAWVRLRILLLPGLKVWHSCWM